MATILAKEMGVKLIVAKAQNDVHKRVLEKVGADRVVFPEREIGVRIDFVELSEDYSIVEIGTLPNWVGKSLKELNIRASYHINVMAVRRDDVLSITPGPDLVIEETDILIVIGSNDDLRKIKEMTS